MERPPGRGAPPPIGVGGKHPARAETLHRAGRDQQKISTRRNTENADSPTGSAQRERRIVDIGTTPRKRWRATAGPNHSAAETERQVTTSHDIAARPEDGTRRGEKTPPVKTPRSVKRVAAVGIPISLAAAAAVSFAGLTELGGFAGIEHPWLMPVAIDVYATTATLIAMLLPEGHRARRTAVWNARLGLAMSMSGNAVARALHLGTRGYTLSDAILTFIGAWPSLIVERLLHLQGHLTAGGESVASAPAAPSAAPPLALLDSAADIAGTLPTGSVEPVRTSLEPGSGDPAGTTPEPSPGTAPEGPAGPVPQPPVERSAEPKREVPQPRSTPPPNRSRGTAAKRSEPAVTSIAPNPDWPAMAKQIVAERGSNVFLSVIMAQLGCSKSTASRLRGDAIAALAAEAQNDADSEPEREREAS